MMQMLAAGGMPVLKDDVRQPDEDNPKGYLEFEAVKNLKNSSEWLRDAEGKAVKMVHLLLLNLPRTGHLYRILMMRRNISEVLRSQRTMLERQGKSGAALSDEQLSAIYLKQLQQVEDTLKQEPNFSFLSVDYNALVANPEQQVLAINDFLDGNLETEKMIEAVDPNLYRQRTS